MKIKLSIVAISLLLFSFTSVAQSLPKVTVYVPEYAEDDNAVGVESFQPFQIDKPGIITVSKIQLGIKNGSFQKYFPDVIFINLGSFKTAIQSIRGNGSLIQRLSLDAGSYQELEASAIKSRVSIDKIYIPIEYETFIEIINASSPSLQLTLSK